MLLDTEAPHQEVQVKETGRLTRLYVAALSTVAFLTILGQLLVQYTISKQSGDSAVINHAGRQRFQSQQIVKDLLILTDSSLQTGEPYSVKKAAFTLRVWRNYHHELKTGHLIKENITFENTPAIDKLFAEIDPHFYAICLAADSIIMLLQSPGNSVHLTRPYVNTILKNEGEFLSGMDTIVFAYQEEARQKITTLKWVELSLLFFTLLVLAVEGYFIFKPAVEHVNRTLQMLIKAEEKALKANYELKEAEDALLKARQEEYERRINRQKIRSASLVEGQEQERTRLARELHDGVGQMLTALKMKIESLSESIANEHDADMLKSLAMQTIKEVRMVSNNLMPSVLNDFGLESALKMLSESVAQSGRFSVQFLSDWDEEDVDENLQIGIYRIAQEALNNAVKYSDAKKIIIELKSQSGYIYLSVKDNGKGFSVKKRSAGRGLSNMQARAALMDADINIESNTGKGTSVELKAPLKYSKNGNADSNFS